MTSLPPHPRTVLPAAERADRNRRIAAAKAAGATWPEVAESFGVSESTARRAAAEHAASAPSHGSADEYNADAIIRRILRGHRVAMERLEPLTRRADNDSARVGANRALYGAAASYATVAMTLGVIGDPGLARFYSEMQRAARAVITLAERHDIPYADVDAAMSELVLPEFS